MVTTFAVTATIVAQSEYEIRLVHPLKPGDQYKVSVKGKDSQDIQITSGFETVKSKKDEFSVEYAATRKVIEVEPAGRAIKVSDVIQQLIVIRGGNRTQLAKSGSVLVADRQGKSKRFEINGLSVDAQTFKALDLVVDLSKGGPTDDDVLGTKKRRKVGETWDINAAAAQDLANSDHIELRNVVGKVKLESVTNEPSIGDVLRISAHFTADARPTVPAGITSFRGPSEARFSVRVPVDTSLRRPEESMNVAIEFEGSGYQNGSPIDLRGSLKRSITGMATPMK